MISLSVPFVSRPSRCISLHLYVQYKVTITVDISLMFVDRRKRERIDTHWSISRANWTVLTRSATTLVLNQSAEAQSKAGQRMRKRISSGLKMLESPWIAAFQSVVTVTVRILQVKTG